VVAQLWVFFGPFFFKIFTWEFAPICLVLDCFRDVLLSEKLAVLFTKFSFCDFLCNVRFLKNLFWCFYNCCNLKLQFGPIFEILTFDFGAKFAKFPKMSIFFRSPISQDPLIGKFQNWVEVKLTIPPIK
jgi:hypothetical protein